MLILLDLSVLPEEDDRELFRAFHRRYEDGLYALLLQTLGDPRRAEDGLQTVMVAILRQFPTLRRLYDTDRAAIGPWAVTITKHVALDMRRKEQRLTAMPEDWDPPAPETTESRSAHARLVELIRSMPPGDREVLELRFLLEWSHRDIAGALGITEAAARKRVERSRQRLILRLREEGYDG